MDLGKVRQGLDYALLAKRREEIEREEREKREKEKENESKRERAAEEAKSQLAQRIEQFYARGSGACVIPNDPSSQNLFSQGAVFYRCGGEMSSSVFVKSRDSASRCYANKVQQERRMQMINEVREALEDARHSAERIKRDESMDDSSNEESSSERTPRSKVKSDIRDGSDSDSDDNKIFTDVPSMEAMNEPLVNEDKVDAAVSRDYFNEGHKVRVVEKTPQPQADSLSQEFFVCYLIPLILLSIDYFCLLLTF